MVVGILLSAMCRITLNCFPLFDYPIISDHFIPSNIGYHSTLLNHSTFPPFEANPIVETLKGTVRGYKMFTITRREIYAFEGIPFAEPPVNDLRFRDPVEKKPWSGILNAFHRLGRNCVQLDLSRAYAVTGHEDCLHLNVFTPALPTAAKIQNNGGGLPVLVWIYGGAFFFGSKDHYGPSYLLQTDIILVTLNYRLGALGFLSTGDDESPGNYGLKDQAMALKWVHENIEFFGGDPKRVTIFGQSAGAASVHFHMLSNQSRNYFSAAISQSGTAFNPWALNRNLSDISRKFAKTLLCPTKSSAAMMKCLRSRNQFGVPKAQLKLYEWLDYPAISFSPTIEKPGPNAFLTKTPEEYYRYGEVAKIPWITGFTRDEGNVYNIIMMLVPTSFPTLNKRYKELFPLALQYRDKDGVNIEKTSEKIRKFYFGDQRITYRLLREQSNMFGDRMFMEGIYKALHAHSAIAPTYGYYFNYYGNFSILQSTGMTREEAGISHYDDIMYLMNSTALHKPLHLSEEKYSFAKTFIDFWSNFAGYGEPLKTKNLKGKKRRVWPAINPEADLKIMEFNTKSKLIDFPQNFVERIKFWESLKIPSY